MKSMSTALTAICVGWLLMGGSTAMGQAKEDRIVRDSIDVLNEIMQIPGKGIPAKMLADAQAVAIVPSVIKGSFIVGGRRGKGVVMIRDEQGGWHAPVFITLTGGNVGWQVGVQSTDVVLVFKTRKSVEGLLSGRMTLGADAGVAAGPVGRQGTAGTDTRLGAQIYSYSRSRGLFAGVSIDGSVIRTNPMSNSAYYQPATPGGPVVVPQSAQQLGNMVMQYTGNATIASASPTNQVPSRQASAQTVQPSILAQQHATSEVDHLREQLAHLAPEMYELLDTKWQQYLAIPAEVFQGNQHPSMQSVNQSLQHFETVRSNSQYAALANHPEFQSTYGLLKHYAHELSASKQTLNLPTPPAVVPSAGR